jgi:hypothetical protein
MFWDAAPCDHPMGFHGASLPRKSTVFLATRNAISGSRACHADIRLRMRPIAREVLDDLVR